MTVSRPGLEYKTKSRGTGPCRHHRHKTQGNRRGGRRRNNQKIADIEACPTGTRVFGRSFGPLVPHCPGGILRAFQQRGRQETGVAVGVDAIPYSRRRGRMGPQSDACFAERCDERGSWSRIDWI